MLLQHAGSFWKETDERIKEATYRTENELQASIKGVFPNVSLGIGATKTLTHEQKVEVRERGQEVVKKVKIRDLNEMFDLLKEELRDDAQKRYYIIIDGLDESWADDQIRYQLIKALIDTVREFQKVRSVKIIACLRTDLIERVFRQTRSAGYQEEKMKSLYLKLTWARSELVELLDKRIDQLAKDSYTTVKLTHKDLLPAPRKGHQGAIEYILDRTFYRPRDIISFFNACIQQAVGNPRITQQMLFDAEGEYSRDRLRSLADEWQSDFPYLVDFAGIFKRRTPQFRLGAVTKDDLDHFCLDFMVKHPDAEGPLVEAASSYFNDVFDEATFRQLLAATFYRTGLLGIKTEGFASLHWADDETRSVSSSEIHDDCVCAVHKTYWRALGITAER